MARSPQAGIWPEYARRELFRIVSEFPTQRAFIAAMDAAGRRINEAQLSAWKSGTREIPGADVLLAAQSVSPSRMSFMADPIQRIQDLVMEEHERIRRLELELEELQRRVQALEQTC